MRFSNPRRPSGVSQRKAFHPVLVQLNPVAVVHTIVFLKKTGKNEMIENIMCLDTFQKARPSNLSQNCDVNTAF